MKTTNTNTTNPDVASGVEALKRINKQGKKLISDWFLVAKALKIGRDENPSHNKFAAWLLANMPTLAGQSNASTRSAALWMLEQGEEAVLQSLKSKPDLNHPVAVRQFMAVKAVPDTGSGGGEAAEAEAEAEAPTQHSPAWVRAAFAAMDAETDDEMVAALASWDRARLTHLRRAVLAALDKLDELEAANDPAETLAMAA